MRIDDRQIGRVAIRAAEPSQVGSIAKRSFSTAFSVIFKISPETRPAALRQKPKHRHVHPP